MYFSTRVLFFLLCTSLVTSLNFCAHSGQEHELQQNNREQEQERERYSAWKERLLQYHSERWGIPDNINLSQQLMDLEWLVNENLRILKKDPSDKEAEEYALYSYNFHSELLGEPKVVSLQGIDYTWLYSAWKKRVIEDFGKRRWGMPDHINMQQQLADLQWMLNGSLEALKENSNNHWAQQEALYAYNFLRESLNQPMAHSIKDIDSDWLSEKMNLLKKKQFIASFMTAINAQELSPAQAHVVEKVQKNLGLKNDIVALSSRGPSEGRGAYTTFLNGIDFIVLFDTPDLNDLLQIIYHEMGHIAHNDNNPDQSLEQLLNSPEFQKDMEKLDRYLEIGKKAFDVNTDIGERVRVILTYNPESLLFLIPPKDDHEVLNMRGRELRAELFAAQHLLEQGNLDVILKKIYDCIYSGFWSGWARQEKVFFNAFEQGIYLAGFLVDNGVDINAEIKKWKHTGTCIPLEKLGLLTVLAEKSQRESELPRCRALERPSKRTMEGQSLTSQTHILTL